MSGSAMPAERDLWALVHDWRYSGKFANATAEDLWFDACADLLEKALDASDLVSRSRLNDAEREAAELRAEMSKRDLRAVEIVTSLLAAVELAAKALKSGQVGHIDGDMAAYHLDGDVCGSALSACRRSLDIANAAWAAA